MWFALEYVIDCSGRRRGENRGRECTGASNEVSESAHRECTLRAHRSRCELRVTSPRCMHPIKSELAFCSRTAGRLAMRLRDLKDFTVKSITNNKISLESCPCNWAFASHPSESRTVFHIIFMHYYTHEASIYPCDVAKWVNAIFEHT